MADNVIAGRIESLEQRSGAVVVLVSCGAEEEARRIADTLVRERLAACANLLGPVRSVYRWKGEVEVAAEHLLLIKTRLELFDRVAARVQELHSYELPEVVALPILTGTERYLDWIVQSTGGAQSTA